MKLSSPIYRLKRRARILARNAGIPLNRALDRIAQDEGFRSWSLLAARAAVQRPAARILAGLRDGELLLIAARPGHGKTLLGLELLIEAGKSGRRGVFFTLEYTACETEDRIRALGAESDALGEFPEIVASDDICADVIICHLANAPRGSVAVIDYLQILDQRRETPELAVQVAALQRFARQRGVSVAFISQIDRSWNPSVRPLPDLADIRLPNPLDLGLFDRSCFLNDGEIRLQAVA